MTRIPSGLGRDIATESTFVALDDDRVQRLRDSIVELERARGLVQAVVDHNLLLSNSPGQQASAQRRIVEATHHLEQIDRELADRRAELAELAP